MKIQQTSVTKYVYLLSILTMSVSLPLSDISLSASDLRTEVTSDSVVHKYSERERLQTLRTNKIPENFKNSNYNVQNDGNYVTSSVRSTYPTAKILVSVMRRSSRQWEPWELNRGICPPSLCTANSEFRPRGTANTVFYNGDIVLDKEYEKIIYGADEYLQLRLRYKRATTRSNSRLWKDGVVPYVFSDTILSKSKRAINKAMREIENSTCIRFRRKKLRDEDFVRFISEPGCWSSVGRLGGEQRLSIGRGCERIGIAIHEISHALGLWHEQARPDRDKYVNVLKENISPRYLPDFGKANKTLVSSLGYPYDYESIMHYSKKAFTNLGEITIEVIGVGKKLNMTIGQRDALSTIDIAQLRDMYKCNEKEDKNVTFCPKGWQKRSRSCYKFEDKKKEQFAGAAKHCEELNSRLLIIDNEKENKLIRKMLKSKYPDIAIWRTAGRKINGTFSWYTSSEGKPLSMDYTNWAKGMPASFSSMAIVRNKTTNKLKWEGVWLGSYKQMPEYAYNFICERRARRKCIKGTHKDGRDYRGTLDHTIDGITCQKWSSMYPHKHKLLPYPFEDNGKKRDPDGLGDHNYCRNPSGARKSRPWCYTAKTNYRWQYCDISICADKGGTEQQQASNRLGIQQKEDEPAQRRNNNKNKPQTNRTGKNNSRESSDGNRNANRKTEQKNQTEIKDRQSKKNRTKNRNKKNDKNNDKRRQSRNRSSRNLRNNINKNNRRSKRKATSHSFMSAFIEGLDGNHLEN